MVNILICMAWGTLLVSYVCGVLNHLPVISQFEEVTRVAIYVIPLLLALPLLSKAFSVFDYLFFLSWVAVYLLHYSVYLMSEDVLAENAYLCICVVFPFYFIGRLIDIRKYFEIFLLISSLSIIIECVYFLVYSQATKRAADIMVSDNMREAYAIMPYLMFLFWSASLKFRIWKLLLIVAGSLMILSCGTRGPLVCAVALGVVYFFFYMRFKYSVVIKAVVVAIAGFCTLFLYEIVLFLVRYFTDFNLSTRVLDKFLDGDVGGDSGRKYIQDVLLDKLELDGSFFGYGFFGSQRFNIIYSHQFFIDVFITFGYFIGTLLLLGLGALITAALYKTRGTHEQQFIILLIFASILKLFFSSTLLYEPFFFLLIGYCVSILTDGFSVVKKIPKEVS